MSNNIYESRIGEQAVMDVLCADGVSHARAPVMGVVGPDGTPLNSYAAPATLASGTPANFTAYGNVRVQVDSLSGGDTITFAGSVASGGTAYALQQILNTQTGAIASGITANGVYIILFAGGLYVTPTKTGSASTPVITASASQ